MSFHQIASDWKQFTGKAKAKWGELTDNDLTTVAAERDQLAGLLQQRYGYANDQAEKELDEFSKGAEAVSAPRLLGTALFIDGRGQPDSRTATAETTQNPFTTKETRKMQTATKHAACEHHHEAAAHHAAASHHHLEAAHHHDVGEHEAAKQHAEAAHEHGQHAHKSAITAHKHSTK